MMLKTGLIIVMLFVGAISVFAQGNSAQAPGKTKQVLIGPVDTVNSDSLTVTDKKNKKTQIIFDQSIPVVDNNKKATKLGAIKIKDLIAIVSSDGATPGGKLKIQKIFIKEASESAQLKRRAVMGVVTAINGNTLTLAHQIQTDRSFTVLVTPLTIVRFKSQQKEATSSASLTTLAVGQRIVAVGEVSPQGITAKLIHIIPGVAGGVFKKLPTPVPSPAVSPTPTSTSSATLTPTPSPIITASPTP